MSYQSDYSGAQVDEAVGKALNPDATPTENSTNLVESGGVARAVSAVQNTVSRRNLFDNWYFFGGGSQQGGNQFPVNQRGSASYSGSGGGYFIDRWKRINSINCSLQSDCLQLTSTNWGMRQVVGLPPGTYTFSMLARKLTYPSGGSMGLNAYHDIDSDWEITGNDWGLYTETVVATSDLGNANLQFNANLGSYSIEILAMKLELGDTQTLAHKENGVWVLNEIPHYAEELAKCQYYFRRIVNNKSNAQWCMTGMNASAQVGIFVLDNRMRAVDKTVTYSGTLSVNSQTVTSITSITRNHDTTLNCVTSGGLTAYGGAGLIISAGGYIDISADL